MVVRFPFNFWGDIMRKALDVLYGGAMVGACLAMISIATLVLLQVCARILDRVSVWLGLGRFGYSVPSLTEIGGFLFVAVAFLALPYTLRAAGHVRVTLVLRFLSPGIDRVLTALVLAVAFALIGFAAWSVGFQALSSFERASVSYGLIRIPLWLPQAAMTSGLVIFAIALLDELVTILSGDEAAFRKAEHAREREIGEEPH